MKLHELKIKEEYLEDIKSGKKTFELRKNDRNYQVGDLIHFVQVNGKEYSSYSRNLYRIVYILQDVAQYGLDKDYCVLSIRFMD